MHKVRSRNIPFSISIPGTHDGQGVVESIIRSIRYIGSGERQACRFHSSMLRYFDGLALSMRNPILLNRHHDSKPQVAKLLSRKPGHMENKMLLCSITPLRTTTYLPHLTKYTILLLTLLIVRYHFDTGNHPRPVIEKQNSNKKARSSPGCLRYQHTTENHPG